MKRQRRYHPLNNSDKDYFHLQKIQSPKYENVIEAEVRDGETLQSIALRFHCTVAEIKRLNKIDKDNEIYARKTIKVPLNPHSVLLETLPDVHKSGQSSPKHNNSSTEQTVTTTTQAMMSRTTTITTTKPTIEKLTESQELSLDHKNLNEKLLIVSVNTSQILKNNEQQKSTNNGNTINHIILNSTVKSTTFSDESGSFNSQDDLVDLNDQNTSDIPLLNDIPNKTVLQPGRLPISTKSILDCSGSDCDISWICLFVCILALCFAIPLIYVLYIAEHPEKFHNSN